MISHYKELNDDTKEFNLKRDIPFTEFTFLTFLSLYSLLSVINSSLLPISYPFLGNIKYFLVLIQVFFLINIIRQSFSWNFWTIAFYSSILMVLGISYMNSGLNTLLTSALILISMKDFDFENILFFLVIGQIVGILIVLISVFFNIVDNIVNIRFDGFRYSLGFLNANTISNYLLSIALKIIYLTRKKRNLWVVVLLNCLFFITVMATDSRTSLILLLIFDMFFIMYRWMGNELFVKIISIINNMAITITFVFSYLIALFFSYGNILMNELNVLFSNRLSSAYKFFNLYGTSILGQKVELRGTFEAATSNIGGALILDNGYLQLVIIYGLIPTILCLVLYFRILKNINLNRNCVLGICVLIYTIYGFNSGLILSWEYNFTLFYGIKTFTKKDDLA